MNHFHLLICSPGTIYGQVILLLPGTHRSVPPVIWFNPQMLQENCPAAESHSLHGQ